MHQVLKDMLAIAIRSLKDRCVTIVSLTQVGVGVMCGWCLPYCTGVVLNTVRESATPDSKESNQADAGSRRFRTHFLCCALLCNFSSTEHEGLSTQCPTGMFSGTFYAQHSVTKNLHISPRFSPTIFYQDANSVLLLPHFCTAAVLLGSIRKTLCLKLTRRYFQHAHFMPIVGVGKRGEY